MLALILFPMVEKAVHEMGHLKDEHCGKKETHFCPQEHYCDICDYVFSSNSSSIPPPDTLNQLIVFANTIDCSFYETVASITTFRKFSFTLRGPPSC